MADAAHQHARPPLSQLWQMPVLAVSLGLFGAGLWLIAPHHHEPAYVADFHRAQALLDAGQYQPALDALAKLESQFASMPRPLQAQLRLDQADAISLGQKQLGGNNPENHKTIVRDYQQARALGVTLNPDRTRRLAASLAALGRFDAALGLLTEPGPHNADARRQVLRQMVAAGLAARPLEPAHVTALLEKLRHEKGVDLGVAAWIASQEGDLLLLQNKSAVDLLLRRFAQIAPDAKNPSAALAPLMVTLGRAYLADGDPTSAERWLLEVKQVLPDSDPISGQALVGLGQVKLDEGDALAAADLFTQAATRFSGSPVATLARIGQADAAARQDALASALANYRAAADAIAAGVATPAARPHLLDSLQTQCDLRLARGEYDLALKLLDMQRQLAGPVTPPPMLLKIANTHEQFARQIEQIPDGVPDRGQLLPKLTPDTLARVAQQYAAAAEAFRDHAQAIKSSDDAAYGSSLWKAGIYFDLAGRHADACTCFTRIIEDRPADPNRLEAVFRLARADQAQGQYEDAIRLYQRILDEHPHSNEAYRSMVPLARCLLAKGPKFVDRAEHVLRSVLTDQQALTPQSREYREALVELGELYYHRGGEGDYEHAIECLGEAVQRYRSVLEPAEVGELQFQLGDAHRKSVTQIDQKLVGSLPPSQRASLASQRTARLEDARRDFAAAIALLAAQPGTGLSDLQKLDLRNSYFYRADCAYDLRQFTGPDGSIELYTQALSHYENNPAALIALIQIVNSYGELGEWDKARAANERAKQLLKRLPDRAFDDPSLPMNREHWQQWLSRSGQLAVTDSKP